jgi:hypothetical protein
VPNGGICGPSGRVIYCSDRGFGVRMENEKQTCEGHGNNWQAIRDFDETELVGDTD